MLKWTAILAVVSLIAGLLGFGDFVGDATATARILFCVFLVVFVAVMLIGLLNSRAPDRH